MLHNPYLYVQALRGTTPWTAVGMVTVLQDHAKHNPFVDGLEMVSDGGLYHFRLIGANACTTSSLIALVRLRSQI